MKIRTYLISIALCLFIFVPASGAVDIGCFDNPRDALVVIPLQGQVSGFTPACVILENGETLTWQNADSQTHDPTLWGCFDPGLFTPAQSNSIKIEWDATIGTLYAMEPGQAPVACSAFGPEGEDFLLVEGSQVTLTYFCQVHPLAMIGKIVVHL